MRWFAAGQAVGVAKLFLQAMDSRWSPALTSMTANELYLVAFGLQLMGLRWFVARRPLQSRWPWVAIAVVLAVYTAVFIARVPYTGNIINIPFVMLCFFSAWILWRNGAGQFTAVSRVTATILCLQGGVAAYRAVLTNVHYWHPWDTLNARTDPRWLYSLAAAAFLASFMVMCELWFLVTELQSELEVLARTDPLTGAMNRRAMEEAALRETSRSIRSGRALSMIVFDIDKFKLLNDTRGHAAGDRALQVLVSHIRSVLRQQDSIARTGGEEFAILLPDATEPAALAIAERARQAVETLEIPFETGPIKITICAGVAQFDPAASWERMMNLADSAMYEAKKRGRNLISARLPQSDIGELCRQFHLETCRYVQAALSVK
jgi:diguanylate cyclase (GGDEF)-like protein